MRDIPRRRKSLLFVGSDLTVQTSDVECSNRVKDARVAMFRATDLANLTVHAFDPNGLQTLAPSAGSTVRGRGAAGAFAGNIQSTLVRQGGLGVLPDHTGGRTVLNTNEPGAEMRDVFKESHSASASQPRNVEMLVTAFSPTARPLASVRQTAQVIVQPNARGPGPHVAESAV